MSELPTGCIAGCKLPALHLDGRLAIEPQLARSRFRPNSDCADEKTAAADLKMDDWIPY